MPHGAIRLGDHPSGEGAMIETSGFPVDAIPPCRLGDQADCYKNKRVFPLTSSDDSSTLYAGIARVSSASLRKSLAAAAWRLRMRFYAKA